MAHYVGETLTFECTYFDSTGAVATATNPHAHITYPDLVTVVTVALTVRSDGSYAGTWTIPAGALAGTYTYIFYGTLGGTELRSATFSFVVEGLPGYVQPGVLVDPYQGQTVLLERSDDTYNINGEPAYSNGTTITARVEQHDKIVRTAEGQEILATSRVYLDAGTLVDPGDRITYAGDARQVVSVYHGRGLEFETHVVAYLK